MIKKISTYLGAIALMAVPAMASAQKFDSEFIGFFAKINNFINDILIPLVFAVALLVFIWGVFNFLILGGGDEDKRSEGKQLMFWAIIGFVVMVSIFGIVNLISGGLGFDDDGLDNIPTVPIIGSSGGGNSGSISI